jgi:hypothetical protein
MSCRDCEDENDAPLPPVFTTQTKASRNPDADLEGTESESNVYVEKQFDKSTGQMREYHPYLEYTEVMR